MDDGQDDVSFRQKLLGSRRALQQQLELTGSRLRGREARHDEARVTQQLQGAGGDRVAVAEGDAVDPPGLVHRRQRLDVRAAADPGVGGAAGNVLAEQPGDDVGGGAGGPVLGVQEPLEEAAGGAGLGGCDGAAVVGVVPHEGADLVQAIVIAGLEVYDNCFAINDTCNQSYFTTVNGQFIVKSGHRIAFARVRVCVNR